MNSFNTEYLMIKISYKDSTLKRENAINSNENRKKIEKKQKAFKCNFCIK